VEVVAICARQPEIVRAVADRLGIAEASTDWRRTLETVRPDIVAVATPASLRGEVVEVAVALGAHLYCDKPLAANAAEARRLYQLVQSAGIKHAYAATHCYDPSVTWLTELVREGAIGTVLDVAYSFHWSVPPLFPWTWWSTEATGGGFAGQFPHILGILSTIIGGEVRWVVGQARRGRQRAPVVPGIHDIREVFTKIPTPEEAEQLEWRAVDIATACSALLRFVPPAGIGHETMVTLTATLETPVCWPPHGMRLMGTEGILIAEGYGEYNVSRLREKGGAREPLPVPQRLVDALPRAGTPEENKWAALARDFIADMRGEQGRRYLTFRDGWRYQEVFDAVIENRGWYELPV
jgi:predicted dehydrogenase